MRVTSFEMSFKKLKLLVTSWHMRVASYGLPIKDNKTANCELQVGTQQTNSTRYKWKVPVSNQKCELKIKEQKSSLRTQNVPQIFFICL